jgi:hypothetical protein
LTGLVRAVSTLLEDMVSFIPRPWKPLLSKSHALCTVQECICCPSVSWTPARTL